LHAVASGQLPSKHCRAVRRTNAVFGDPLYGVSGLLLQVGARLDIPHCSNALTSTSITPTQTIPMGFQLQKRHLAARLLIQTLTVCLRSTTLPWTAWIGDQFTTPSPVPTLDYIDG
jgi:hypothetical protein